MSEGSADRGGHPVADPHSLTVEALFEELETGPSGLSSEATVRRRERYGENQIREEDAVSPLRVLLAQFQSGLIYVLVVAAVLSIVVGLLPGVEPQYIDAVLILAILLANGLFGFVQDYRAEQSIRELREFASPDAMVVRDGEKRTVDATALVPGDVIVVEQGDVIPADARLIEASSMETMEASLTGESGTVPKSNAVMEPETPLAERENVVFKGTSVTKGRGTAVVVGTGMETEIGAIATHIQESEDEQTPFQHEVGVLGRQIGYGIGVLIVLVALVQFLFTGASPIAIVLTAVTLAVAAVPEGLPAIVTLTLALGSRRMIDRNALVRRLPVVESLGSVDVVLTDKTGTLTENRMTVRRIGVPGVAIEVTGAGYETDGEFRVADETVDPDRIEPVLRCGAVCNNAERAPDSAEVEYFGDPTEIALLVAAAKAGIEPNVDRLRELPFSAARKRMTVVVSAGETTTAYTKGATEAVLDRCNRVLDDGTVQELTAERRDEILSRSSAFASDALRVLGFARRELSDPDADEAEIESDMIFLGVQGMLDPPREGVDRAIDRCRSAGVRTVMVTGDDPETARAVGEEVGIASDEVFTGPMIDERSEAELREDVESVGTFARVEPGHKVQILQALQANDHTVAMTGDGVNDAPGLRSADVGIAMGIRGTDIAKEASDMVLQDDNFVTIVEAIAEGRRIFDNIRKFVNLLLSANTGEVLTVFFGVLVGTVLFTEQFATGSEALILTPVMLLWINLVTDGLPAIALGVDPRADGILERSPRPPEESVIDRHVLASVLSIGLSITVVGLLLFFETLAEAGSLIAAQTVLFTFIVVTEMGIIQVIRRRYGQSIRSNPYLVVAVVASLALHGLVLYTPLADLFGVVSLGWAEWGLVIAGVVGVVVANYAISLVFDRVLA
ncbi:MAG: cation-translocating P-type ATPase [Halanaeroarchaeum sp.]